MERIYQLARVAGESFSCYGVRIGVRVSNAGLLDGIRNVLLSEATIRIRAEHLGAKTVIRSLLLGAVVFTRYRQSSQWRPRLLSHGQAVIGLLANAMSARQRPELNIMTFSAVIEGALLFSGPRDEATETVKRVLKELEAHH